MSAPRYSADGVSLARTFLFVPGDRPDRFDKAKASGADEVVLDLEDAVAPDNKVSARDSVAGWLQAGHVALVRLNAPGTRWVHDDIRVLGQDRPLGVVLPKVGSPEDVSSALTMLPAGSFVLPIIESAEGVRRAYEICCAPGVVRPILGNGDLALELGVDFADRSALAHARAEVRLAAAAAGLVAPVDGVTTVNDNDIVAADTADALAHGYTGKICIHPRQIQPVHSAMVPTSGELAWATRIVAASDGESATLVDGAMVDQPVFARAQQLLRRARAAALPDPQSESKRSTTSGP